MVFGAGREQPAVADIKGVLQAAGQCQIAALAVGIQGQNIGFREGVAFLQHPATPAVVAVAIGVLGRGVEREFVLEVWSEPFVGEIPAGDAVVDLLGDVGLVGRQFKIVSAAPEFADAEQAEFELASLVGLEKGVGSKGGVAQQGDLGKAVSVGIPGLALAVETVDGEALVPVFAYQRAVEGERAIGHFQIGPAQLGADLKAVLHGLPGDHVHRSGNGIAPEEG